MADEADRMENALTCFSFLDSKKESHEVSIFSLCKCNGQLV